VNKQFQKLVAQVTKAGCVGELLQCGGTYNVMPNEAIVEDWQHALLQAQTDLAEHLRFLSGEDGDLRRKSARRCLAVLVAVAAELEANLDELD